MDVLRIPAVKNTRRRALDGSDLGPRTFQVSLAQKVRFLICSLTFKLLGVTQRYFARIPGS